MTQSPSFSRQQVIVGGPQGLRNAGLAVSQCLAIAVLELDSPDAGAVDDLLDATATVASEVTVATADLKAAGITKLTADGAPARTITFTTAGGTASDAPANVAITGKGPDGNDQTETLNLSQTAGTVESVETYSTITTLVYPAADGTDATVAVGIGDTFGLPAEIKVRGDNVAVLAEEVGGAVTEAAGPRHESLAIPVAPATSLGTITESTASGSATTQPGHPVTLDVAFAAGWEGGDITISGTGPTGLAVSEAYTANPGSTVTGTIPFAFIDASGIVNSAPAGAADAATVQTGVNLAITTDGTPTFLKLVANGADEAFAATDAVNNTFEPTTAPDGLTSFDVYYSLPAPAAATPATSGPYGTYTPPVPPDGSTDFLLVYEQVGKSNYGA